MSNPLQAPSQRGPAPTEASAAAVPHAISLTSVLVRGERLRTYQGATLLELVRAHDAGAFALWEGNRDINATHARKLAMAFVAREDAGPLPVVIGVLPCGAQYLLDGQHRLEAARSIAPTLAASIAVIVCRERCADEDGLRRLFKVVNSGLPVPERYYNEEVKRFAADATEAICKRWPGAVGAGKSAQKPRFLRDELLNKLCDKPFLAALKGGRLTTRAFIAELEAFNKRVEQVHSRDPETASDLYGIPAGARGWIGARASRFYAGMLGDWPTHVLGRLEAIWADEADDAAADRAEVAGQAADAPPAEELKEATTTTRGRVVVRPRGSASVRPRGG